MTHLFHLAFMRRRATEQGGAVTFTDGLPPPTEQELADSYEAALAEWNRQQQIEAMPERRADMAAIFDALPIEQQAALFSTRVAVEQALDRGRLDIARQLVVAAVIPGDLEPTREAILALFPSSP